MPTVISQFDQMSFQYSLKCCDILIPSYIVWMLAADSRADNGKKSPSFVLSPHSGYFKTSGLMKLKARRNVCKVLYNGKPLGPILVSNLGTTIIWLHHYKAVIFILSNSLSCNILYIILYLNNPIHKWIQKRSHITCCVNRLITYFQCLGNRSIAMVTICSKWSTWQLTLSIIYDFRPSGRDGCLIGWLDVKAELVFLVQPTWLIVSLVGTREDIWRHSSKNSSKFFHM